MLSLICHQQLETRQGQTICALLPWSEAMSLAYFRVNPMTNVLGDSAELSAVKGCCAHQE